MHLFVIYMLYDKQMCLTLKIYSKRHVATHHPPSPPPCFKHTIPSPLPFSEAALASSLRMAFRSTLVVLMSGTKSRVPWLLGKAGSLVVPQQVGTGLRTWCHGSSIHRAFIITPGKGTEEVSSESATDHEMSVLAAKGKILREIPSNVSSTVTPFHSSICHAFWPPHLYKKAHRWTLEVYDCDRTEGQHFDHHSYSVLPASFRQSRICFLSLDISLLFV